MLALCSRSHHKLLVPSEALLLCSTVFTKLFVIFSSGTTQRPFVSVFFFSLYNLVLSFLLNPLSCFLSSAHVGKRSSFFLATKRMLNFFVILATVQPPALAFHYVIIASRHTKTPTFLCLLCFTLTNKKIENATHLFANLLMIFLNTLHILYNLCSTIT